MPFARVAVNVPSLVGVFDYHLPEDLHGKVAAGHLVTVPFGRQTAQGVVLELVETPAVAETRAVLSLLDPLPALTLNQIRLARWLAEETLTSLADCIGLMLPTGLEQHVDSLYTLAGSLNADPSSAALPPVQRRILNLLQERGPLRGRQIGHHFRNVEWQPAAEAMSRRGLLTRQAVLPPPSIRPKVVCTAQLCVPPQTAEKALPGLGRTTASLARRQAALRLLINDPSPMEVAWVYAGSGCTLADLQELAERELIVLQESEAWRDPLQNSPAADPALTSPPALTPDQQAAWDALLPAMQSPGIPDAFLLHGVTGSGKTEIYLRAAEACLQQGRQALILVPEIALTPQTVHRFLARFPGRVGLVHSRLSDGERYDTWRRTRLGKLDVIIGARSALFTPQQRPGLIAVDECHDGSYHQSEPPFYSAVQAAREYARLCGALCLLGSATPTIEQRYQASPLEVRRDASLRLLELPRRILNPELPPVQVVDMRAELSAGSRGIFSRPLQAALQRVLALGQQAILYLNRRGTATYVFCRACGVSLRCPRCDSPLTFHTDPGIESTPGSTAPLRCHRCGYSRRMPDTCPACGSDQLRQYGLGSEKVETELQALHPSARILRWDRDTTRRKGAHELILSHFAAHRADVLVGTQMLAKGLDFPLVTLAGIVLADMGLNLPDPFAAERTFNLLTQVAGRAGRSALGGEVILQTYQPEHYVIRAAAGHDYAAFYARELEYRRSLGYPPFMRLVRLEVRRPRAAEAEDECQQMAEKLADRIASQDRRETTLIGPAPCFFGRLNGQYRWQVVLRGPDPAGLVREAGSQGAGISLLKDWRLEVDPVSLL